MHSTVYSWTLVVSALICGALALYAWNRRPQPGASGLAALMFAAALWSFFYAVELAHSTLPDILFWLRWEYLGIAFAPPSFLLFILQYSGRAPRRKWLALLYAPALVTLAMVWSTPYHGLFYSAMLLERVDPLVLLIAGHGPFYWWHAAYSYITLWTGAYLLARLWLRATAQHRAQVSVVLLASAAPLVANVIYILGWFKPLPHLDLTPFAFTLTGLLIALAVYRYRLLELRPLMHDVLLESLRSGVVAADAAHRLIEINPVARTLLGLDERAIGRPCTEALAEWPELLALCDEREARQCQISRPRGAETLYLEARAAPLLDNQRRTVGNLLVLLDISAQQKLQTEQRLLARILEESLNEVYVFDAASLRFVTVNRGARENLGYSVAEMRAMTPLDLKPNYTPESFAALLEPLRQGRQEALRFEGVHRRKDGSTYPVEVHLQLMREEPRALFVAIIQDITQRQALERERLEMQQRLLQAQKLESLGALAGGVAHDFNNLLTGVLGNLELTLLDLPAQSPLAENLREAERAAQQAAALTRQMLAYSGKGKFIVESLDLSEVVEGMADLLRSSISRRAALDLQLARDLPRIQADPSQVRQALLSLAINASEALGERQGAVAIRTGVGDYDAQTLRAGWSPEHPSAGRYVFLEVADSGEGIGAEVWKHLFEPFYSTKFVGRGLGLAATLGIMRGYGGAILVRSEPGAGSAFTLLWPAAA